VLDHFFNLMKKSNLIGRLQYDLTQFFDNLVVAYFLGHPNILRRWAKLNNPVHHQPISIRLFYVFRVSYTGRGLGR